MSFINDNFMLKNETAKKLYHEFAKDLPITVNDPSVELELLYIDDFVDEMLNALENKETLREIILKSLLLQYYFLQRYFLNLIR